MRKIIVDSAAGLPSEVIEKFDLEVARLQVMVGKDAYYDGEISIDAVFEAQDNNILVATSQPSPQEFLDCINRQVAKGATEILILTISKGLSGTIQSAVIAKGMCKAANVDIRIVNTGSASVGEQCVILEACEMMNEGTFDEFEKRVFRVAANAKTILTVDNLGALVKTGRISRFSATIGNLLKIKPVLQMINDKVEVTKKCRGKDKIIEFMAEQVVQSSFKAKRVLKIIISHVNDLATATNIAEILSSLSNVKPIITDGIGPVLAVHLGRGGYGIGFTYEDKDV